MLDPAIHVYHCLGRYQCTMVEVCICLNVINSYTMLRYISISPKYDTKSIKYDLETQRNRKKAKLCIEPLGKGTPQTLAAGGWKGS